MVYETLLLIGGLGLTAQFVMGLGHGGHDGHRHAGGNGHGPTNGHGPHHMDGHVHTSPEVHHASADHAAGAHLANGGHANHSSGSHSEGSHHHGGNGNGGDTKNRAHTDGFSLLALLSPLSLFSICLGAGATGLLLRGPLNNGLFTAVAALLGGLAFNFLVIKPVQNFVLRFASKPAKTLKSVVAQEVEVLSRFDDRGRGMVRAEVDGEVVSVLAYLETDDRKQGVIVTPGERLVVTQVDPEKNTVRVTRL